MNEAFYELRNGKPYLGEWLGKYVIIDNIIYDETVAWAKDRLENMLNKYISKGFEIKEKQFVERKPSRDLILEQSGTIGIKFCLFGRAFEVKRLLSKGIKRYKKVRVNGKYKKRRIDKRKDASMLQKIC